MNTDPTPKTMTVNVTWVNQAPQGTSNTVTTLENVAYVFHTADFGFSDPNDAPPNNFLAVEISTLPGAGTLTDNGTAVTAGQFVSVSDISAGKLLFTPAPHAYGTAYAGFTFQVEDDGGTANGGVNLAPSRREWARIGLADETPAQLRTKLIVETAATVAAWAALAGE